MHYKAEEVMDEVAGRAAEMPSRPNAPEAYPEVESTAYQYNKACW
jgi:hypothetical protein